MKYRFEEWIKDDNMEERDNTTSIMVLVRLGSLEVLERVYTEL